MSGAQSGSDSVAQSDTNAGDDADSLQEWASLYETGVFYNGAYGFTSVVYTDTSQECWTDTYTLSDTNGDNASSNDNSSSGESGAPGNGDFSDQSTDAATDSSTSSQATSYVDNGVINYNIYESGSYGGGIYSLSSVNLSISGGDTQTQSWDVSENYTVSGSDTVNDTGGGSSGVGDDSSYTETGTAASSYSYSQSTSYNLTALGSYANGGFSLSSFVLSSSSFQGSSNSDSSSSSSATLSGTSGGHSYTGSRVGDSSGNSSQDVNASLSEQGIYGATGFNLSCVVLSVSGGQNASSSDNQTSEWTGDYNGRDVSGGTSSGDSEFTAYAAGNYAGGSFSLASYSLSATAGGEIDFSDQGTWTRSDGSYGCWGSTDDYSQSASFSQTGSSAAGQFANVSYNFNSSSDNSQSEYASSTNSVGYTISGSGSSDLSSAVQIMGSGMQGQETMTWSCSWSGGSGGDSGSNSSLYTATVALLGASFSPPAPDASPLSGVGLDGSVPVLRMTADYSGALQVMAGGGDALGVAGEEGLGSVGPAPSTGPGNPFDGVGVPAGGGASGGSPDVAPGFGASDPGFARPMPTFSDGGFSRGSAGPVGQFQLLSAGGGAGGSANTAQYTTHLPSPTRGRWVEGTRGDGVFMYTDTPLNRLRGIVGVRIRYAGGQIAQGGFPAEWYYRGSAASATVAIENFRGDNSDMEAADTAMQGRLRNPRWRRPDGYTWNHVRGPNGENFMELVQSQRLGPGHASVAHEGPPEVGAARRGIRNARRGGGMAGRLIPWVAVADGLHQLITNPRPRSRPREAPGGFIIAIREAGQQALMEFVLGDPRVAEALEALPEDDRAFLFERWSDMSTEERREYILALVPDIDITRNPNLLPPRPEVIDPYDPRRPYTPLAPP